MERWEFPEEPPEAQPPPGVRLDEPFIYGGNHKVEEAAVKITYIDDQDDGDDWVAPEIGPTPEPIIVG